MPTLGEFGVDTPKAEIAPPNERSEEPDRCILITDEGTRCSNSACSGRPVCHPHIPDAAESIEDLLTIRSPPRNLIRRMAWSVGQCRAEYATKDERCRSSVQPFKITCSTHSPAKEYDLVAPDRSELQFELIEAALKQLPNERLEDSHE